MERPRRFESRPSTLPSRPVLLPKGIQSGIGVTATDAKRWLAAFVTGSWAKLRRGHYLPGPPDQ